MNILDTVPRVQLNAALQAVRSHLIGRPASAIVVLSAAVVAYLWTAQSIASTASYLPIQYSIPTYDGSAGPLFYAGAFVLVALATASAVLDAGVVPTVTLAGAPVAGWAVNHFSSTLTPHYAATFPVEMAVLYGGVFGVVGYLLGTTTRRVVRPPASLLHHSRDNSVQD